MTNQPPLEIWQSILSLCEGAECYFEPDAKDGCVEQLKGPRRKAECIFTNSQITVKTILPYLHRATKALCTLLERKTTGIEFICHASDFSYGDEYTPSTWWRIEGKKGNNIAQLTIIFCIEITLQVKLDSFIKMGLTKYGEKVEDLKDFPTSCPCCNGSELNNYHYFCK